jgi:hypothetical protein
VLYRFHVIHGWNRAHIEVADRLDADLDENIARSLRQADRRAAVLNAGGEVR